MSTSSGRKGSCDRCGNFLDGHALARDSKCKKCKKLFEICQVTTHRGWRICFIPCRCGEQYYPDKARAAVPLASHEYHPNHPGYRALSPDENEHDATTHEDSSSISQGGGYTGHSRTDSVDSEDPLAWSAQRYEQETTAELVDKLDNTHIGESNTTGWSEWAWHADRNQWGRYRMSYGKYEYEWQDPGPKTNQEGSITDWSEWVWHADRNQWGRYRMSYDKYEYEWRNPEPASSSTSNQEASSETGKGKGKEKGKEKKRKGKGKGK